MKTSHTLISLLTAAVILLAAPLQAGEGHTHKEAGPNGGRLITSINPHAEFYLTADRKVQFTFVGEDGKTIPPAQQVITVITGDRSAPIRLTFEKSGAPFVSEQAIPEGNNFPVVVQIKATPDGKSEIEKFTLNLSECPGCKLAEYACTCDHQH